MQVVYWHLSLVLLGYGKGNSGNLGRFALLGWLVYKGTGWSRLRGGVGPVDETKDYKKIAMLKTSLLNYINTVYFTTFATFVNLTIHVSIPKLRLWFRNLDK